MLENGTEKTKASGIAKAGLTTGIIGTSLAGLLTLGNGGLGGIGNIFGGGNVDVVPHLEAEVAELKAMRYTDQVAFGVLAESRRLTEMEDAKINALQRELFSFAIDLDKKTALNEQAMILNRQYDTMARDYQFALVDAKIDSVYNCCKCTADKAELVGYYNKQLNELADASIISYVNSNFAQTSKIIPASSICPPVVLQ